jgi:hypothetical protein
VEPERGPDHGPLIVPAGALRLARIARTGTIRMGWRGGATGQAGAVVATITARQARAIGLRAPAGAETVVLGRGASGPEATSVAIVLPRPVRDALVKAGTSLRVRLAVTVGQQATTRIVTLRR